jgi:hypothetical protein
MTATKGPVEFRPMKGLLSLLDRAAVALGVSHSELYAGEDGLRAVAAAKLEEIGVPETPIALTGNSPAITPRKMAEQAGFIKRRKRIRTKR